MSGKEWYMREALRLILDANEEGWCGCQEGDIGDYYPKTRDKVIDAIILLLEDEGAL